MVNFSV